MQSHFEPIVLCRWLNAILWAFWATFTMRMHRSGTTTSSSFRSDHVIQSDMVENLSSNEILAKNTTFRGFWAIFPLRTRRNDHNSTSGIKSDHAVRSGMPENLYVSICGCKRNCKGSFRPVCTVHARKGQNTTSGFRSDPPFDPAWSKT